MKKIIIFLIVVTAFLSINLNAKEVKHAPTDVVNIPDNNLKEYINVNLGNPLDQDITYADMESLIDFRINKGMTSSDKLTSLEGMQYATNITSIQITGGYNDPLFIEGIDFSPIANLPNLDMLVIQQTDLKDISSLEGLQARVVNLGYNEIEDISVIQSFSKAENIELFKSNIEVLPELEPMPNLQYLTLNQSKIYDVSPIVEFCKGPTLCAIGHSEGNLDLGSFDKTNIPDEYVLDLVDMEGNTVEVKLDMSGSVLGANEKKNVPIMAPPSSSGDYFSGMINFSWTYTGNVPTIEGVKDTVIKEDEEIDLLKGVTAKDVEDGDLTSKIVVDDSNLNNHEPGKYEVIFTVTDKDGNDTESKEIIEVKEEKLPITPSEPDDSNNISDEVVKEEDKIKKEETKEKNIVKKLIQTGKENIILIINFIVLLISLRIIILNKRV